MSNDVISGVLLGLFIFNIVIGFFLEYCADQRGKEGKIVFWITVLLCPLFGILAFAVLPVDERKRDEEQKKMQARKYDEDSKKRNSDKIE